MSWRVGVLAMSAYVLHITKFSLAKPDFHTKNRRDIDNAQGGGGPLTVARDSDATWGC